MMSLILLLAASAALPPISVVKDGGSYRLSVGPFKVSQGPAVNEALDARMRAVCRDARVEALDADFETTDPANELANGPPVERAIFNFQQTFRCVGQ